MPISVAIGGSEYPDVIDASIRFSMDEIAPSFELTFSDKWLYSRNQKLPFEEGSLCTLYVNNKKSITGFIDNISISYESTSHSIKLSGRSMAGLLVDCSVQHKTGSWKNSLPKTIIEDLISPYKISFSYDTTVPPDVQNQPIRRFAIEQEETVFDAISRIAKLKGFFLISNANGDIVGARAGQSISDTTVQNGINILNGKREGRFQDRYSSYLIKSQNAGDDTWYAENATSKLFSQIEDTEVPLHKPLIIVSDTQGSKQDLDLRAKWEKSIRAGRSKRLTYTLQGFEQNNGELWRINQQIYTIDDFFDVYGVFLASTIDFQYSLSGSYTTMELVRPEAYDILLPTTKKKGW